MKLLNIWLAPFNLGNGREMKNPQSKSEFPNSKSISGYLNEYSTRIHSALASISQDELQAAFDLIEGAAIKKARIYVAGNGGSSAIADHLCCDWTKGTYVAGKASVRVHSLTANTSLLTALANDLSYEDGLSEQLKYFGDAGDVVLLISSSGNSPNIIRAAETARSKGMTVVGLSGFSGGRLKDLAQINLHVAINNYGMVEDAHQMLMHVFAQMVARARNEN